MYIVWEVSRTSYKSYFYVIYERVIEQNQFRKMQAYLLLFWGGGGGIQEIQEAPYDRLGIGNQ